MSSSSATPANASRKPTAGSLTRRGTAYMSPTPTALIPEISSNETAPVPTLKQTEESVSPDTLLLFDKIQSWFTARHHYSYYFLSTGRSSEEL
jgi:hypothetical protein